LGNGFVASPVATLFSKFLFHGITTGIGSAIVFYGRVFSNTVISTTFALQILPTLQVGPYC